MGGGGGRLVSAERSAQERIFLTEKLYSYAAWLYLVAGILRLKSRLGPKGQAVIPKEIRELMGIRPGSEVMFEVRGDEVVVKPLRDGSSVDELTRVIPRELKLVDEVDLKKIILSEALERWST